MPVEDHRLFCNGYKQMHALKFQSGMSPFGIITHLFGLLEGTRHDAAMLHESGLLCQTEQYIQGQCGTYWVLHGDPVYPN